MSKRERDKPKSLSSHKLGRSASGNVSYEDLIVAQYLDEIRKATKDKGSTHTPSPYLQQLLNGGIRYAQGTGPVKGPARPMSATVHGRSASRERSRIDAKFIADPAAFEAEQKTVKEKRKRPSSAPAARDRARSNSFSSYAPQSSARTGSSTGAKIKPLYKKQPKVITVTAFKNGGRDVFTRVTAPTIKELLEMCTIKLSLLSAARRVFLSDGREAFTPKDIPREAEVFISQGEPYKDPYKPVKTQEQLKRGAMWTMNGILLPQDVKRGKTKMSLSKRLKTLVEKRRHRILIFLNGQGVKGQEVVASLDALQQFLDGCTGCMSLSSPARVLYDWSGKEIVDLNEADPLDKVLQTATTPVLGPLWVSKGEGFSPAGVEVYIQDVLQNLRPKLRAAKDYKSQLQLAAAGRTGEVDRVELLSMDKTEIKNALNETDELISDLSGTVTKYKEQLKVLEPRVLEERDTGHEYKMKHIKSLESTDRLVGRQGLRLKVFENGRDEGETLIYFNMRDAERAAKGDSKRLMEQLLATCTACQRLANPVSNPGPALSSVAKKLYDRDGREITNIYGLQTEQEVWLSFGEDFKPPSVSVLQVCFDKAQGVTLPDGRTVAYREPVGGEDSVEGIDRHSHWEATVGFPLEYDYAELRDDRDIEDEQERIRNKAATDRVVTHVKSAGLDTRGSFLQNKEDTNTVLYPELSVQTKKKKGWPPGCQTWVINQSGLIYSRAMPQLALTVNDNHRVETEVSEGLTVAGFGVTMQKRMVGNPAQQWSFSPDGYIFSVAYPDLVLTFLGDQGSDPTSDLITPGLPQGVTAVDMNGASEDSDYHPNLVDLDGEEVLHTRTDPLAGLGEGDRFSGQKSIVDVVEKVPAKHPCAKFQRWALKQEDLANMGQWKKSKISNPEWNKLAYSWPVTEEGVWNKEFKWPLEGFLIPMAPPLRKSKKKNPNGVVPLRLKVVRNGDKNPKNSVVIVGPDLTNMMRDMNKTALNGKKALHHKRRSSTTLHVDDLSEDMADALHCDNMPRFRELEMQLFLERCTTLMDLPFAARRLFDDNGKEHSTLTDVKRDQVVFVSCGETWVDPKLTESERQRRTLLANLASDVAQIRHYVTLRNPEELVMMVSGPLQPGSSVLVEKCTLSAEQQEVIAQAELNGDGGEHGEHGEEKPHTLEEILGEIGSAHERSHQRSEERLASRKRPWEQGFTSKYDEIIELGTEEEPQYSDMALYSKFRPKSRSPRRSSPLSAQRFLVQDGWVEMADAPGLVLGVAEQDVTGTAVSVVLVRKRDDDINQRWTINKDGSINIKSNYSLVLGVALPPLPPGEDSPPPGYAGVPISLQPRRVAALGAANQRWLWDPVTGFIKAFATDVTDKEITAANKAGVCTYAVTGAQELEQPGYTWAMPTAKGSQQAIVCVACSRAMRGSFRLTKLNVSIPFSCAMGTTIKQKGQKFGGCFHCLNGKVDLSTYEAEKSLEMWEEQLEQLRKERSVRTIQRQISAVQMVQSLRVLAFRNGEGWFADGTVLVGSSVYGLLEQATHRLNLASAARRIYTADGNLVLDMKELIDWAVNDYEEQVQAYLHDEKDQRDMTQEENRKEEGGGDVMEQPNEPEFTYRYTNDDFDYCWDGFELPDPSFTFSFEVKAASDAHIALSESNANEEGMYEIVIGTMMNRMSAIRQFKHEGLPDIRITQRTPDVLSATEYHKFWISYDGNGTIEVRRDGETDPIVEWTDPDPLLVRYVGYSTGHGCDGEWHFTFKSDEDELDGGGRKAEDDSMTDTFKRMDIQENTTRTTLRDRPSSAQVGDRERRGSDSGTRQRHSSVEVNIQELIRHPISVWVSCGEPFISPDVVASQRALDQVHREERESVLKELQKEKHILHQMQGRRYKGLSHPRFVPTTSSRNPVMLEGGWMEPSRDEVTREEAVEKLETHLSEVKAVQKVERKKAGVGPRTVRTNRKLYQQPTTKRVLVYPNGESADKAVYAWGANLPQLLESCTIRLSLQRAARTLYTADGQKVQSWEDVERDQLLCVSSGESYMNNKASRRKVEVKAAWSRARKQEGMEATDVLMVTPRTNPKVEVDPYGPPVLALPAPGEGGSGSKRRPPLPPSACKRR
ncbi:DCDC1 [Branchiostoma lanceolatum]|uniref:DCDC1 protein n=1 Tax=Branchiostoma lanceolatum TaxID=7740 RepID=A0A8J9ZRT9_BRALA|nr:DCDC1 [Branchiostoma lanceolatum]